MTDVHVAHNLNECFICGAEKNFHTKLCMFTVPDTHSAEKNFHTKLCMFTVPDTHSAEKTFTQNIACSQCQIHTVHTCKLSQAQTTKKFVPVEYRQPLPTPTPSPFTAAMHTVLYSIVGCGFVSYFRHQ